MTKHFGSTPLDRLEAALESTKRGLIGMRIPRMAASDGIDLERDVFVACCTDEEMDPDKAETLVDTLVTREIIRIDADGTLVPNVENLTTAYMRSLDFKNKLEADIAVQKAEQSRYAKS